MNSKANDIQKDSRRLFTAAQKRAVQRVTGETGEADHVMPYSQGGPTEVENCQLISADMNKRKGGFCFTAREWQSEFLTEWSDRKESAKSFLVSAVPGSGKTMAALEVARRWKAAGADRRVIVVVPTDNLRIQWSKEAVLFGMELQTKEFGSGYKSGFHGAIATYSLVANMVPDIRMLCSVAPTMVIFDEVHHCGEDATYGLAVTQAFQNASELLLLSGTPWKSNGQAIPFIRYDAEGYAVADYEYEYKRALSENVIRYLVFHHSGGLIINDQTGTEEKLDKHTNDIDAAKRLRRLIDSGGEYAADQIVEAHSKLMEVRKSVPDAAAMAICMDQAHARRIAKLIKEKTGCEPSIIVSDEAVQNDDIETFKHGTKEWLVSVKKVSEGTDIKRLQVLCYLTNTTSELFFRQVIGRVCRVRGMDDFEGHVYLPADPRLIRAAENIERIQMQALKEDAKPREPNDLQKEQVDMFDTYSTQSTGLDVVFIAGEKVDGTLARQIEMVARTQEIPLTKCYEIYKVFGKRGLPAIAAPARLRQQKTKEEVMDDLRKKCSSTAFKISKKLDIEPGAAHKLVRPFKPQDVMSEQELRAKLAFLINILDPS